MKPFEVGLEMREKTEFRRAVYYGEEERTAASDGNAEQHVLQLSAVLFRRRGEDPRANAIAHVQANNPPAPLPSLSCLKSR